jgi:hypothetical protein
VGALHLFAVACAVAWLLADPLAEKTFQIGLDSNFFADPVVRLHQAMGAVRTARTVGLVLLAAVVVGLLLVDFPRFVSRRGPRLTVRRLLFITTIIAAWSGIAVGFPQIAWQGKRLRSMARLEALDAVAMRLHEDWPSGDGEMQGLGPFTAYPFGRPAVLLLLAPYPLDRTDTVIAAIERSSSGVLRFQLRGSDGGDWIEWHGGGSRPASFTGGLLDTHGLKQYVLLRDDWYLVRYDTRGNG